MSDHVLLVDPWAQSYLCGSDKPVKPSPGTSRVVARFEIVRERKTKAGHTPITLSDDLEWGTDEHFEGNMCAACHSMLIVARANGITLDTPNLKSRIKRLLRDAK